MCKVKFKRSLEGRVSALEKALNVTNVTVARMILQEGREEARLDAVVKAHNDLIDRLSGHTCNVSSLRVGENK